MEIKQPLTFLQTLGAKSVSDHHMQRVYVIMKINGAQVQLHQN